MEAMGKTDEELFKAVKQSLIDNSLWNNLISNVETEIIKLFEEKGTISTSNIKPQQPEMIELINKLIFEYMDWMGYKLTNSVFMKESGTEIKVKTNRKYMASQLDLEDNDKTLRLPLLTVLLTMFKNKDGDKEALDD
ncbi:LIS1 homology motif,FGFR1 oncogene partner (FOP), N-terminal dimerisation domain [Cinara cedri]|uniref:LIS1 homology motif,FGFR1 oncogene partner (FOP), N-terminal dimerisation domain n=1 Tax=Cinara cedri TaxID=506608 RepID=A0A5E4N1I4_9HEMI|nr:LIS1 homology motif,FGFR1 oncogene partner (FOP), N-terminal dimerisation domain [Cinara cedri]